MRLQMHRIYAQTPTMIPVLLLRNRQSISSQSMVALSVSRVAVGATSGFLPHTTYTLLYAWTLRSCIAFLTFTRYTYGALAHFLYTTEPRTLLLSQSWSNSVFGRKAPWKSLVVPQANFLHTWFPAFSSVDL